MDVLKRNNVKIFGKGKQAIIFAHGYGCDQNIWRLVTPAFEETHTIILFDHVGAGLSDPHSFNRTKYNSLSGYADDLLEICRTLNLLNPIFVGHSVSSMIGILAAIESPQIFEKIVLIGPSACYINRDGYFGGFTQNDIVELLESIDKNYHGWSTAMAPALMGNPDRPQLAQELVTNFTKVDPDIAKHFARTTFLSDHRKNLEKVKIPALILQCTDDLVAPATSGEFINTQMINSKLIKMQATGHFPALSAPEETIKAIKNFI